MIASVAVGPMDNNAYLIRCAATGVGVLVDAAAEADRVLELVGATALVGVVTTHRHADHLGALAEVLTATGVDSWAGAPDAAAVAAEAGVPLPRPLSDRDHLTVGAITISVIALRGHTPGSIALAWTDPDDGLTHLVTGDSLFPGGPGKTRTPKDFRALMTDLEQRVFARFDDDTVVHPGHGLPTTLGAERGSLPEWWARGW